MCVIVCVFTVGSGGAALGTRAEERTAVAALAGSCRGLEVRHTCVCVCVRARARVWDLPRPTAPSPSKSVIPTACTWCCRSGDMWRHSGDMSDMTVVWCVKEGEGGRGIRQKSRQAERGRVAERA